MPGRYGLYAFDTSGIAGSSDTLAAAITSTTATSITLTSGTATVNGTQIQVDSERMLVTAGGGTSSLTVQRGFGGTTAATHANGATVSVPGALTYNLLPVANVPNQRFTFAKRSTDIGYVQLKPYNPGGSGSPDTIAGGATSIILADNSSALGSVVLHAPGNGSAWLIQGSGGTVVSSGSGAAAGDGWTELTIASNAVTPDLSIARAFRVTINQSTRITINNPVWTGGSIPTGQVITIYVEQDSTGGRPSPAWGTAFGAGVVAADIPMTASTRNTFRLRLIPNGAGTIWSMEGFVLGQPTP